MVSRFWGSVTLLLLLITSPQRCVAQHRHAAGAVIDADEATWAPRVVDSPYPAFTFFYSSEHNAVPPELDIELQKLATKYEGIADVVKVDCAPEVTMRKLCQNGESIPKLPHMRVYSAQKTKSPYTKQWYKDFHVYEGAPQSRDMSKAIQSQLVGEHIVNVNSIEDWLKLDRTPGLPQALVFSRKQEPSVLMRAMAMHFMGRLDFVLISSELSELVDEFSIDEVPALVLRHVSGETEQYEGEFNAVALSDFLRKSAPETVLQDIDRRNVEDAAPILSKAKYHNVSLDGLPQLLEDQADMWLLAFMTELSVGDASEECIDVVERFVNITHEIGDMIKVGLVTVPDARRSAVQGEYRVELDCNRCMLDLRLKPFGSDVSGADLAAVPHDIDGKTLVQHVYTGLSDMTVHMTDETLPTFMGMQPGGPSPLTPKVILATAKHEAPPLFKLLATNFRDRDMVFGWFSPELDPEVAQQIPTSKVPSMMIAYVDPTSPADEQGRVPLHMEPYSFPFKYAFMSNFLESVAQRLGHSAGEHRTPASSTQLSAVMQGADEAERSRYSGSGVPGGAVIESGTDDAFASHCLDLGGICLVALLQADAGSHAADLAVLQALASLRRGQPIHFTWVDAPRQRAFAAAFVSEGAALPAAFVLAPRKMRFSALQGAFTQESLSRFLDKVLGGQMATVPLSTIPKLTEGGDARVDTGHDASVEEEFDLSEIMGTEVEDSAGNRDARLAKAQAEAKLESSRLQAEAAEKAKTAKKEAQRAAAQKAKRKREAEEAARTRDEL